MKPVIIDGIAIFLEEAEKYAQINDISGEDLVRIWGTLNARYPGFEICLCFHDMQPPVDALAAIGAEVLENCLSMAVRQEEYKPYECGDVVPLMKEDFAAFAALHDVVNPAPDMYWTSQRLLPKWDNWRVFVIWDDGKIIGYSLLCIAMGDDAMGEIFAVEADEPAHRKALFSAAVGSAFENGKSKVFCVVDRDNIREYEDTLAVGFREVGYYIGYVVRCL